MPSPRREFEGNILFFVVDSAPPDTKTIRISIFRRGRKVQACTLPYTGEGDYRCGIETHSPHKYRGEVTFIS